MTNYLPLLLEILLRLCGPIGCLLVALTDTPREERPALSSYNSLVHREGVLLANSPSRHTHRPVAATVSQSGILRESVSIAEVNHFYDDRGLLVFDQLLFYEWSQWDERHQLVAWRMVKHPAQLPRFEHSRGIWVCEWFDGGVQRRVEAIAVRESWTQYDPELTEREYLPKEKRRELRKK